MAGFLQPLDQKFPIVNPDGTPTDYFTRWAQQRMDDIVAAATADQVSAAIDTWAASRLINTASPLEGGGSLAVDLNLSHAASGVTAGTYGDAANVAQITVDAEGHITAVVDVAITGGGGGSTAWSSITGTPTSLAGYGITDAAPLSHVGSGGGAHALVVAAGAAGFMSGADKTKLNGIAVGATVNATDAFLLARANHTGTQAVGTITGLGYFATGTDAANLTGTVVAAQLPAMTGGDVTSPAGSAVLTIGPATVTLAKMANLAANSIIGNNTGAGATPIALTIAQVKTLLAIAAGDISGLNYFATGTDASNLTGTLAAARIAANSLVLGKLAQIANNRIIGNVSGGVADPAELTAAQVKTMLAIVAADISDLATAANVQHPGYISGNWYWTVKETALAGGATFVANNIKLLPFTISKPITVTQLAAHVTTSSGGGNFQLAIYANNATTGRPTGSALCSTGNISTASTGAIGTTLTGGGTALLNPGTYWMAINQDNGVAIYKTVALASPHSGYYIGSATLANISTSGASSTLALTVSQAFGTWPSLTSASFTEATTAASAVLMMKAA